MDHAVGAWSELPSDEGAAYDTVVEFDVDAIDSAGDLGHEPGHGHSITGAFPIQPICLRKMSAKRREKALEYMDLTPGTPMA